MSWRHIVGFHLCLLALACGPGKSAGGSSQEGPESGESGAGESNADELGSESSSESGDATTSADTDTGESTDTSDDEGSMTFVPEEDGYACSISELSKCEPFAQDCSPGEKCTPIVVPICGPWDRCTPVIGDNAADEACTVVDQQDDCDADSWCYAQMLGLDAPAVCVGFCQGNPDDSSCANPDYVCVYDRQVYEGYLGCRPRCNPLEPDLSPCLEGEACKIVGFGQRDFGCVVASAEVPPGEPCDLNQECDGGQCIDAMNLLECAGDACCSSFCDVLAPDCPAGTECELIEVPDNPESTVGVCAIPA